MLSQGARTLGRGALEGYIGNAANAGLQGAIAEAPTVRQRFENARKGVADAAVNPLPAALGAAGGVLHGGARGFSESVRDPLSETGHTLGVVAREGGEINMTGEPVTPTRPTSAFTRAAELPHGKAGYNRAAAIGGNEFADYNAKLLQAARDSYGHSFDGIAKSNPQSFDMTPLFNKFDQLIAERTASNGVNGDPDLAAALGQAKSLLTARVRVGNEFRDIPAAKLTDVKIALDKVRDAAEFDAPATKDNRPYRLAYKAMAGEMANIDPRLGPLNQRFAATMDKLERANDIVYGSEDVNPATRARKQAGAAAYLGRAGDPTQAGTTNQLLYEELRGLDPKYERIVRDIEAKKAMESLRYGKPEMSTNIEKVGHSWLNHNLDAAKIRVGLPVAEGLAPLTDASARAEINAAGNPILGARQEQAKRQRERAAALGRP
jgi:hypothetical protein